MKLKQTKEQLFWEIFRFLLVGGTATIVDYCVFGILDALLFPLIFSAEQQTLSLILATACGFCVGLVVNWILSVRFVFKATSGEVTVHSKKAFSIFALIGVFGLLITEVGVVALVSALPAFSLFSTPTLFGTAWKKWLAKAIMTCVVLVWNYLGRKIFVFKS